MIQILKHFHKQKSFTPNYNELSTDQSLNSPWYVVLFQTRQQMVQFWDKSKPLNKVLEKLRYVGYQKLHF